METKTLTLGVGSLIRILGPALSFVSASEAADQNCPARQHPSATQHVGDGEDLRPSIIQPNENANGRQESLEPFSLQHFEASERQNRIGLANCLLFCSRNMGYFKLCFLF